MLEITRIRDEKETLIEGLKKRGVDFSAELNEIVQLDEIWRAKKTELETVQSENNKVSKEIGKLIGSGKIEEANEAKEKTAQLKTQEQNLKDRSEEHTSELQSRPHLVCRLLLEKKKKKKDQQDNVHKKPQTKR